MNIILPDYEMVWHNYSPQYECKSLWPIFHGPVILPYIWKIIWQMNIILPDYKISWHNVWPQYECRSVWPIFYGPVILFYMWKTIWHINIILPDYEMVFHNIWPEYECWSVWPMFNGPVILLCIWKTVWHMKIILPDYQMVLHGVSPQYDCKSLWPLFLWSSDFALYLKDIALICLLYRQGTIQASYAVMRQLLSYFKSKLHQIKNVKSLEKFCLIYYALLRHKISHKWWLLHFKKVFFF